MTEHILASLVQFVIWTISSTGYSGVCLLMAIESACIPLPSEIIMPFAGALTSFHLEGGQYLPPGLFGGGNMWLGLIWVATAGAIGCNLGSVLAYWIGAIGGRPAIERFGKYVLLSRRDLDRVTLLFEKHGSITVLVGRLLPVVRTFIALPAGIARMPQLKFHVYTFVGSWPWCFVLAYFGARLGRSWNDPNSPFHEWFHRFHLVVELALVAGIVWFVYTHWKHRNDGLAA